MSKPLRATQYAREYDEHDIRQAFATLRNSKEKLHLLSARRIIEADVGLACMYRLYILVEKILSLIEFAESEVLYLGDKGQLDPETVNYYLIEQLVLRQAEAAGYESAELITGAVLEDVGEKFG